MKFKCPHCRENAVSAFSKYRSYEASPAVCNSCGKFSAEPTWINTITAFLWTAAFMVLPIMALINATWLPIIIGLTFFVFLEVVLFLAMPLRPIAEATVKSARWEIVVVLMLLVTGGVIYAAALE